MKPLEPIHPLTEYTSFFIHECHGLHTIYGRYSDTGREALGETTHRTKAYDAIKDFIRLIQSARVLEGLPPYELSVGYIRV